MSKSSKTTTDSNSTITPTNPAQISNGLTGFADQITNLQGMDPYSFTAGPNALQTQAAGTAAGLGSAIPQAGLRTDLANANAMNTTGAVMGASAPTMSAATANPYIQGYMDPYTNDVVKSSLAGFDQNAGLQNQQAALNQAQDSTFGGSGGSIYKALLNQGLALDRGQLESGLRSQGYAQALAAAQEDANRQQQASQVNAGLADSNLSRQLTASGLESNQAQMGLNNAIGIDQNNAANLTTQAQIGEGLRQIQLQHQLAPLSTAAAIGGLWGSAPFSLLHGQNDTSHSTSNTTTSDPMGTIGGILGGAGSLAMGLGGLGLGGGMSGGLFGQLGAGSLSGMRQFGIGNTLSPMQTMTAG